MLCSCLSCSFYIGALGSCSVLPSPGFCPCSSPAVLVLFCMSSFLWFSSFRFSIHSFWFFLINSFFFFTLLTRSDLSSFATGSPFWPSHWFGWLLRLLLRVFRSLSPLLPCYLYLLGISFPFPSGLLRWYAHFCSFCSDCLLSILFLELHLRVLLLSSFLFSLRVIQFLYILGFLWFRLLLRVQLCFLLFIVSFNFHFEFLSGRRASGKFPRLLFPFFSIDSSVPHGLLRLASSSIPSGPLCP